MYRADGFMEFDCVFCPGTVLINENEFSGSNKNGFLENNPCQLINHYLICANCGELNVIHSEPDAFNSFSTETTKKIDSARHRQNLIRLIKEDFNNIYKISPREFEQVVAEILSDRGYEVTLTPQTRDGGVDIYAYDCRERGFEILYAIECKRYAPNHVVGPEIVRAVYGVHTSLGGANKSIIITTSTFTSGAIQFAHEKARSPWELKLMDHSDVREMIRDYTLYKPEDY